MEVVLPTQGHGTSTSNIVNDIIEHVVDNEGIFENDISHIALGSNNDQLTLASQVTPPSWLAKSMINFNEHNVSSTH